MGKKLKEKRTVNSELENGSLSGTIMKKAKKKKNKIDGTKVLDHVDNDSQETSVIISKKLKKSKKEKLSEEIPSTDTSIVQKSPKRKKKTKPLPSDDGEVFDKSHNSSSEHKPTSDNSKKQQKKLKKKQLKLEHDDNSLVKNQETQQDVLKSNKKQKQHQDDNAVVTSESESDDTDTEAVNDSENAEKAAKKESRISGPDHSVFVGNLPNTVKRSTMKTLFKKFGKILTVRFRTFDGVMLLKKKDKQAAKSLNCYVRFSTKQEAEAACAMNGETVEGNRIRVSMQSQKQLGHIASTVFVGNIHRKTTDNELYDFFNRVGEIEYVRQIADKGIGYVCFKKGVSIMKALKLNQQLLNGRPLRIMKVDPNLQFKRKNKKGNLVTKNKFPHKTNKTGTEARNHGNEQSAAKNQDFHGAASKTKHNKKHKAKSGKFEKQKKLLARKLTAAGTKRQ